MAKPKRVPGLDYSPQAGDDPNVSFGVIQAVGPDGKANTMEGAVCRRLYPRDRPADPTLPWNKLTCEHSEVILTPGASDEVWKPQALCRAYDRAAFPSLRDIMFNITLRAPELELNGMRVNEFNRIVVEYARAHLAERRRLPVIIAVHVPARSAMPGPVHWHVLTNCRSWSRSASGPATFCTELLDGGRRLIEREWSEWKKAHGL